LLVPIFAYFSLGNGTFGGSWQLFVILCAIPCAISSILAIFVVPESPRWLCARGRSDEALVVLRNAARTNGQEDPLALFPEGTILTSEEEHSTVCDLFSPQWKWITLRLWGTWFGFSLLYYGTILAITFIFSSDDEEKKPSDNVNDFDYFAILVSSSAELVGLTLVIFIVDTVGRIPSQSVCYLLGGMCVFLLCLLDSLGAPRAVLLPCSFSARLFLMGATCLTWVSTSEILSTDIRTTGHSAANAIARIGGAMIPYLITDGIPLRIVGIIMLCISLVTARVTWKLPETKGVAMGTAAVKVHRSEHATELSVPLIENEVI